MPISAATSTDAASKTSTQISSSWNVIVHDDPVNMMEYVTLTLQRVFSYPKSKAERMMMEVHQKGKSIVWSGEREKSEHYVSQLHGFQLKATLEKIS